MFPSSTSIGVGFVRLTSHLRPHRTQEAAAVHMSYSRGTECSRGHINLGHYVYSIHHEYRQDQRRPKLQEFEDTSDNHSNEKGIEISPICKHGIEGDKRKIIKRRWGKLRHEDHGLHIVTFS